MYLTHVIHMPNLESIFVSGTYLARTCEVEVVVGCSLTYISKNVRSMCNL